jgi:hypothetical protein
LGKRARTQCKEKIHVAVADSNGRKNVQVVPFFVKLITTALLYKNLPAIEDMPEKLPYSRV